MSDMMTMQEAARTLRRLADMLDPPQPKAEWVVSENRVMRDGTEVAFCDNRGRNHSTANHRATVTMHALRADELGVDVIALLDAAIEETL